MNTSRFIDYFLKRITPGSLFEPLSSGELDDGRKKQFFYLDDGYVGFVLKIFPMSGADDESMKRVHQLVSKKLPEETIVQFSMFGSPNIYEKTRFYRDMHKSDNDFLNEFISERTSYMENATTKGIDRISGTQLKSFEMAISYKIPRRAFSSKQEHFEKEFSKLIEEQYYTAQTVGLVPVIMTTCEYVKYVQTILNWRDSAFWKKEKTDIDSSNYDPTTYIRDSFFEPGNDLEVRDKESMLIGDKHVGVMSVHNYKEHICVHDMVELLGDVRRGFNSGIKGNFLFTVNIIYENQSKLRSTIEKKDLSNKRQAFGPTAKWVPEYKVRQADFDAMKDRLDNGSIVLKVMHTISLFGDSKREIDSICTALQNYWNGKEMSFHRETTLKLPVFLQQIPLNASYKIHKNLGRYWQMPSEVVAHSLPIITEYAGGVTPAMLFSTRLGAPAFFDLYESQTSFSGIIIAESGSGKSVLSQYLVASYLAYRDANIKGCRTWIIDIGYSYQRFCNRVGGSYVDFKDPTLVINPFEYVKEEEDYKRSVEMLLGIISVMAVPTEKVTDLQSSALREHLRKVWDVNRENTTIDLIAESLAKDSDPSVSRLARQIRPFTTEGDYGSFFNGRTNVDMHQNDFIIIELEGLKDAPALQSAVLYMVMYSIAQAVNSLPKSVRKQVLVDEGWAIIAKKGMDGKNDVAEFLEGMYRTIRKKMGSCIFVSQSCADLSETSSGKAILENSPNKFLLGQNEASVEKAKMRNDLILDDYGWNILKSVTTRRGVYSEIFVMQGSEYGVVRLAMSRHATLLFTTDGREVSLLDAIEAAGHTTGEAIDMFVSYEEAGRLDQLLHTYLRDEGFGKQIENETAA